MLHQWTPLGRFWPSRDQSDQEGSIDVTKKSVILLSFLYESSYLLEIFSISSSGDSAKLTSKFWPLLNQPARHGPFRPKLWTALATVFVGIFFWKKFWLGSRPIPVTHWKEFWIFWKKWCFQIFQKLAGPDNNKVHSQSYICLYFDKNTSFLDMKHDQNLPRNVDFDSKLFKICCGEIQFS